MFDREFFAHVMPRQIQDYGGSGAAMVVVRAYRGGAYVISGIEKPEKQYVWLEVYRREFGINPSEWPHDATVATPAWRESVALPYKNVAVVKIGVAIRPEVAFHHMALFRLSRVKKHEFLNALTKTVGGTIEIGDEYNPWQGYIAIPYTRHPGLKWQFRIS